MQRGQWTPSTSKTSAITPSAYRARLAAPGTLAAFTGVSSRLRVAACVAGIEPTVSVTVRLAPSPPVTASLILSPAA